MKIRQYRLFKNRPNTAFHRVHWHSQQRFHTDCKQQYVHLYTS